MASDVSVDDVVTGVFLNERTNLQGYRTPKSLHYSEVRLFRRMSG